MTEQTELEKKELGLALREKNLEELERKLASEAPEVKRRLPKKRSFCSSSGKARKRKNAAFGI